MPYIVIHEVGDRESIVTSRPSVTMYEYEEAKQLYEKSKSLYNGGRLCLYKIPKMYYDNKVLLERAKCPLE